MIMNLFFIYYYIMKIKKQYLYNINQWIHKKKIDTKYLNIYLMNVLMVTIIL